MKDVIGLLDCHNSPELGELTANRSMASTSFLGRYAFMDIALSNFSNSAFGNLGILVRDHQRSMLKHMGTLSSWVNNTKTDKITLMTNEKGLRNPAYNSDINNIKENDYFLYDSSASTIVIASPHIVAPIDMAEIVEKHRANGDQITAVYKSIEDADEEFLGRRAIELDENGYIKSVRVNDGKSKKALVSLELLVIERVALAKIIGASDRFDATWSIFDICADLTSRGDMKVRGYEYKGYARCFTSLKDYEKYSFELLDPNVAKTLFREDWPIFTLTHNTAPALYGAHADIRNSIISNGCVIDGTVEDSIICRNVKIGKSSTISHCIILSEVSIGEHVTLSNMIIDKYSCVASWHTLSGDKDNMIYIKQGALL